MDSKVVTGMSDVLDKTESKIEEIAQSQELASLDRIEPVNNSTSTGNQAGVAQPPITNPTETKMVEQI